METISQSDFDNFVSHTIRIELKEGFVLTYQVSAEAKKAFRELLVANTLSSDYGNEFLWIYIPNDRLALVNKKNIIRITFCFDSPEGSELQYCDNFSILEKLKEEDDDQMNIEIEEDDIEPEKDYERYLPQLIIMHNRQLEDMEIVKGVTMKDEGYFGNISFYSSLNSGDIDGCDFEYFNDEEELILVTYDYLQFIDDDGEENFMPFDNLSVIEVERPLIMTDELLDNYLGRKSKGKSKAKKK